METIRQLSDNDWALYKRLRLESLSAHIELFCPSENEFVQPDEFWKHRLRSTKAASFMLFVDGQPAGITTVFENSPTEEEVEFAASYIVPAYRNRKLSRLLYEARIQWAKERHYKRAVIYARVSNVSSIKANAAAGFKLVSSRKKIWSDGTEDDEVYFELPLK